MRRRERHTTQHNTNRDWKEIELENGRDSKILSESKNTGDFRKSGEGSVLVQRMESLFFSPFKGDGQKRER